MLCGDSARVGVWIGDRAAGIAQMPQVGLQRFGHPRLDFRAGRAKCEDAFYVVRALSELFQISCDPA